MIYITNMFIYYFFGKYLSPSSKSRQQTPKVWETRVQRKAEALLRFDSCNAANSAQLFALFFHLLINRRNLVFSSFVIIRFDLGFERNAILRVSYPTDIL